MTRPRRATRCATAVRSATCLALAASCAGCAGGGHDPASGYDPLPPPPPPTAATAQGTGQSQGQRQDRAPDSVARADQPDRPPALPQADADAPPPGESPESAEADSPAGAPAWYGDYLIDGVRHRGFSAAAGDVRSARAAALAAGYEAVPGGRVVAYQAVALPDGRWRFFVLVAADGGA